MGQTGLAENRRVDGKIVALGAAFGLCAVALGAFGAHALAESLGESGRVTWETATRYHLAHALALVLTGALGGRLAGKTGVWAAGLFAAGIVLFSGSLYLLATAGWRWLGPVTPLGGLAFLAAWTVLGVGALRASREP